LETLDTGKDDNILPFHASKEQLDISFAVIKKIYNRPTLLAQSRMETSPQQYAALAVCFLSLSHQGNTYLALY